MANGNEASFEKRQVAPEALIPGTDVPHNKDGLVSDPGRQERLAAALGAGMRRNEAEYWAGSGVKMSVAGASVVVRHVLTQPAPQSERPPYVKRSRVDERSPRRFRPRD